MGPCLKVGMVFSFLLHLCKGISNLSIINDSTSAQGNSNDITIDPSANDISSCDKVMKKDKESSMKGNKMSSKKGSKSKENANNY